MQPSGTADRRWRGSSSLWISIKPAFFTFLSEPLRHGFAVTAFYAVASAGAGRSPPETSTPFRGERVPVGGRSPVENSAVASDIAERAPLGHSNRSDPFSFVNSVVAGRVPPAHSNRADRRDRWCEPFSAVASVVAGRAPPGHSNRADRRESQGCVLNSDLSFCIALKIAHSSLLIIESPSNT